LDIIVCVKHVPECAEAEIKVDSSGKDIVKTGLVFDINEWDDYAVEEAVRIKEKHGGTVTAITVGSEEVDATLRKCLARGVDYAIRVTDPKLEGSDSYVIANVLSKAIKSLNLHYDLILTGALADDDMSGVVGPVLAELLGIRHATLVKRIEFKNGFARVNRELEGGVEEVFEIKLPALFTIQTGINEPRYVSLISLRKAMQKQIKILSLADIGLSENDVGEACSWIKINKMYIPPVERRVELITGSPGEVAAKIAEIIKGRGLI
jgi:electron transfer flavoprotein beta subunit